MNTKPIVLALLSAFSFAYGAANATLIITPGPGSAGDTDNVIFNACTGNNLGPALTVQGCVNTAPSSLVNFTGEEDLLADGGQARVIAADGVGFEFLQINFDPLASSAFTALSFNINAGVSGNVTILAQDTLGGTFSLTAPVTQNGSNFFHVDAIDGQLIQFVTLSGLAMGALDFAEVRQVRISPNTGGALPEPGMLGLAGMVLGMVALSTRRRTRR